MTPRITLLTAVCVLSLFTNAQQRATRINSGEIMQKGVQLHDDGKYKEALAEYDKIPVGDSNYVWALYESALSCSADSQFARGIAYCEKGLADRSDPERDPEMLLLYGSLLDYNEQPERALQVFDSALQVYPAFVNLYNSKGTTLLRLKRYAEAEKVLQQGALINPYSANLHHKLGLAAVNQGKVVPAFLCMMACLTIEPGSRYYKEAINVLSEISKSTDNIMDLVDKRRQDPSDNFREVERIVLSKIALDPNYKIIIDLDDKISRQAQVILEKLAFDEKDRDFYMQYYVPVFKKIYGDKKFEFFINYIFSNVNLPSIQEFNKKKKKDIDALKEDLVAYFDLLRSTRELQYTKRSAVGPRYQFSNGKLYGKGVLKDKETNIGPWTFYFTFGNKKAEGLFNEKGGKEGAFSYYSYEGQLKAVETFRDGKQDGPQTYYFGNGRVSWRETYKNGEPEGLFTSYHENGVVKTTEPYKNGKLNGVKKTFFSAGPVQAEEHFVDGKREGVAKTYYVNGQVETEVPYVNDEPHGNFKAWNSEGVLISEGTYAKGKLSGIIKRYDDNGKLSAVETYDGDGNLAEYASYYDNGKPAYGYKNKNGKTNGDINYYDKDGKLYSTLTFDNDRLRAAKYFDKTGKQVGASESKNGKLNITAFNADGTKQSMSTYDDKGVITGDKLYYYGSGKEKAKETYKDGSLTGEAIGYYPGGQKSYSTPYEEGVKSGYYTSWYTHGGVQEEGWYGDDKLQGEWLDYDRYGALTTRAWFLNGSRQGLKMDYWPNGKAHTVYRFDMDKLQSMIEYDTTGKIINIVKLDHGNGKLVSRYPNGKLYGESNYVDGDLHGPSTFYYFDGSTNVIRHFTYGLLDSSYKAYHYGGQLQVEGQYHLNDKTGTWKYYNLRGKMYRAEEYKLGKPVKTRYYFDNGKLDTEIDYKDGQRHGFYKRYAEDGSLMYQVRYENGLPMAYSYLDKNGKLVPEIPFKQGNGKLKAFYQNGNPSATMQYVDGVLHGDYTLYFPNGKVWITEAINYDDVEGVRTENFPDGKLHIRQTYKHNNYLGPYKEYNEKGVLIEESNFYDDSLHGEQRLYDDNGKLKQVRTYYYGLLLEVK
jgi:antitoxin component YwqK of YwqJK toxin-antitoxin module/Tfp pilus assembly protein PilF